MYDTSGGGINLSNTQQWLDAGASHVIITIYVFTNGKYMIRSITIIMYINFIYESFTSASHSTALIYETHYFNRNSSAERW